MKPTRILASATLLVSSLALITAAGISVGDEPGVIRMDSHPATAESAVPPTPDPLTSGTATLDGGPPELYMGVYPQPEPYAPYFDRSYGATQQLPPSMYQAPQPFGPIMMFESNIGDGLGYTDSFQRVNARIPYHIIPNTNVLIGDVSASVTNNGDPLANLGVIYRNYDASTNRILGWNAYGDYDQGYGNGDWYQVGAGFESLGKYIDFFAANGYLVTGTDSRLLSSELVGGLFLAGNNVFRTRNEVRDNAYSGFDAEVGGPLPVLGQYGINMYVGGYYLGNADGDDAPGFQARWQALITESLRVNTYLTSDDTFGTNSWVSLQYDIPNYKNRRVLRDSPVRDRLQDPVNRSTRIHTNIDRTSYAEACINSVTGLAYTLMYVDPNATGTGTGAGTFENPFSTMQLAAAANSSAYDIIRVEPRDDASGTNLTINGGLTLFDDQALISANNDYELFRIGTTPFFIPGTGATGPGPLLTRPDMLAGESIVRLANNSTIVGMQFNAANAAGTVFGNGVSNPLPVTGVNLTGNTFSNYVIGADLQDVSGRVIVDGNTFTGRPVLSAIRSTYGLRMTTAGGGSTTDLLLTNNTATTNQTAGLSVTAVAGSTLNAHDLDGDTSFVPPATGKYNFDSKITGITDNTVTGNGNGIEVFGNAGSTINAAIEDNTATGNTNDGLHAETNAGNFNLASLRNNTFSGNGTPSENRGNGAFLRYTNGGIFRSVSEDRTEDLNLNGVLDPGEDTNGNGRLDVANGTLDAGEDLNGNGSLDEGIVSNVMSNNVIAGLCIFGDDSGQGFFDIGGESSALGNTFIANGFGGMAADLTGTAEGTINALNNTVFGFGIPSSGDVIRTGFTQNSLAANDDFFTGLIDPGFELNFFGQTFNNLIVNNNGNITFDAGIPTFTPFPLVANGIPMIAPFFADVDTRAGNLVTYGTETIGGRQAFGVDYHDVRHFSVFGTNQGLPTNDFQLVLIDRSDVSPGDFDIEFNYRQIQWEAGEASGSNALGLGGNTARVGYTNGVDRAFELPGSAVPGAFLDSGPAATSLVQNSLNSSILGRYVFESRNGSVTSGQAVNDADGMSVRLTDNAVLHQGRFINNTVSQSLGNGIKISASNNAVADNVVIQGNTLTNNRANGVGLSADGAGASITAVIGGIGNNTLSGQSFAQANQISNNGTSGDGDGINATAMNGALIQGGIFNNQVLDNGRDGIGLIVDNGGTVDFGTPASNRLISGNTITGNSGAGIRTVSNVSASSQGIINAVVQKNTISRNASGGIVSSLTGPNNNPPAPPAVVENNVLNLTVGGPALTDTNTLDANGDVGIGVDVAGNGRANVNITGATITNTTDGPNALLNGDGINLRRSDSSLLTASITDVTSTGNAGDGLDVLAQGTDRTNPNQPMSGAPNWVKVTDSIFNNNAQNGAIYRVQGNATLIGDTTGSSFNNNGQNGLLVQTSQFSSFGDPTGSEDFNMNGVLDPGEDQNGNGTIEVVPPGRRSLISGNSFNENGVDGVQLVATDDSRILAEITSNAVAAGPGPHTGANTNGNTSISRNGRDGIRIDTSGGQSDIVVTAAGTAETTIDGNGTAAGGNGIRWNASGDSQASVRITNTTIRNSIAGVTETTANNGNGVLDPGEDLNGNGALDPGEDTNSNGDVDVVDGDGIQANFTDTTSGVLVVGGVGEGNVIQSNADDGIAITATGRTDARTNWLITPGAAATPADLTSAGFFGPVKKPTPIISILENTIGGENNGVGAGNGGDGISINTLGGTEIGTLPDDVDSTITVPPDFSDVFVSDNFGAIETGAVPKITISGNAISRNTGRGANVLLTGAGGTRDRELGASLFDPIEINFTDNNISSNGKEGIFYRADSDMTQNRFVYLANFPDPPVTDTDNQNFSPFRPEFLALNNGSVNNNTSYMAPYLNLRTVQNSLLTVTGNTIQNNGTGGVTGEGLFIKVGTGSYAAADIQNNVFGGNLEEDFRTASFVSADETFTSVDNTGDGTFDFVYLDDTAQLDVRFQNNSGTLIDAFSGGDSEILAESLGATYTQFDQLKRDGFFGDIDVLRRQTDLFQVDNGPGLNDPNNIFQNFGSTQDINDNFSRGGTNYNVRNAADAQFPNIGFAPFLP